MQRLWVVEYLSRDGRWDVCNFGPGAVFGCPSYASTNYYKAHQLKREIQEFLNLCGHEWATKNRFRVRGYIRKEK